MRIAALTVAMVLWTGLQASVPLAVTEAGGGDRTDASGLWETTAGASVLCFERQPGAREAYSVTIVEAADFAIAPGTHAGTLTATATPDVYDAEFLVDPLDTGGKRRTHRFVVEFDEYLNSCTFRQYRKGKRLSLKRMLPYLFRIAVVSDDTRPEGIDGAVRLDAPSLPIIL